MSSTPVATPTMEPNDDHAKEEEKPLTLNDMPVDAMVTVFQYAFGEKARLVIELGKWMQWGYPPELWVPLTVCPYFPQLPKSMRDAVRHICNSPVMFTGSGLEVTLSCVKHMSNKLREDDKFFAELCRENPYIVRFASTSFLISCPRDVVRDALTLYPNLMAVMPEEIQDDVQMAISVLDEGDMLTSRLHSTTLYTWVQFRKSLSKRVKEDETFSAMWEANLAQLENGGLSLAKYLSLHRV